MKKYEFFDEAENELRKSVLFYKKESLTASNRFYTDFERSLNYVRKFPLISPFIDKPVRRKVFRHFPFNILYILKNNIVYIVSVTHHSQHPDHWKDRMKDIPK